VKVGYGKLNMSFEKLDLIEPILNALKTEGYTHPTPIQAVSIPIYNKSILQREMKEMFEK